MNGVYIDPSHVIEFTVCEIRQEFSICFRATPTGGTLRTSDESTEILWVAPSDMDELNIHPSIQLRIRHSLDQRTEPYYS